MYYIIYLTIKSYNQRVNNNNINNNNYRHSICKHFSSLFPSLLLLNKSNNKWKIK